MVEIRPFREQDEQEVTALRRETFRKGFSMAPWLEGGQLAVESGRVVAALRTVAVEQVMGGRSMPAHLMTSVMVAPHARGRGLGSRLVRATLGRLADEGVAICILYPTSMEVYRRCGFEIAGSRVHYAVAPMLARALDAGDGGLSIEPWETALPDEVMRFHERFVTGTDGGIRRPERWWLDHVLAPLGGEPPRTYLVRHGDEVRGYVVFDQMPDPRSKANRWAAGYEFAVVSRDLVSADLDARRALLSFLGSDDVMCTSVEWIGPVDDEAALLFPLDVVGGTLQERWMATLVDIPRALELRGYPNHLSESIVLSIDGEPHLRLTVEGGQATLKKVETRGISVRRGHFTAIYTGWLSGTRAERAGVISNASGRDVSTLDALFAAPDPWMLEAI